MPWGSLYGAAQNPGRLTADGAGSNDGKPCAKLDAPQVR